MTQLATNNKKRLARPLKVLVPLIKQDLKEAEGAAMNYYIAAGEKLKEAKSQLDYGQWSDWLARNFHLSQSTAADYMRLATKFGAGEEFETIAHSKGDRRASHEPPWTRPVAETLKNLRMKNLNLRRHELSLAKERGLERDLALQLIDIGYKVLSVKLHPDKGGSHEAMQRLNTVRRRLKDAA